jgi:phage portal protein BeeE
MTTQSKIVDRHGSPFISKSTTAPNLDPEFWVPGSNDSASVKTVLQMPYAYHVWIYKCVNAIAQNVSQLEKLLQEVKSGSLNKEHAILSLFQRPNQLLTQSTFFRLILCQLLLPAQKGGVTSGGQSFIVPWNTATDDKVNLSKGEIPSELFPYSEAYFEPWYGDSSKGRQQVLGWTFRIPQAPGSEINFAHNEIIRINMLNPYDILKGMSPFSPVASAVEMDARADVFNSEIFANSGRLDGQVSSEQFIPTDELDKMKTQVRARNGLLSFRAD